ncbi:MAG: hypothetical protein HY914_08390 [Desulfomonile tiedjei]|nr:hypothetical protein [Desulfomonile tiedjei]
MHKDKGAFNGGCRRGTLLGVVMLVLCVPTACLADGYAAALVPTGLVSAIESVVGPIFPEKGFGSTFRSEFGTSVIGASIDGAKLTGDQLKERDLRRVSYLDVNPLGYDFYADLRLWRFGLRTEYSNFQARSNRVDFARFDLSGLRLAGTFDVIQFCWLAFGASADFLFIDPTFQGSLISNVTTTPTTITTIDLKGKRPVTVGAYLRYVPPEILNMPVHVEIFGKIPWKGSKLKSYGGALVFRPQIYRFDLAARLLVEKTYLKFTDEPMEQVSALGVPAPTDLGFQNWELDMEWTKFGFEVAAYF